MVGVWVKTVPRGTSRGLSLLHDGLSGIIVRELSGQQRRPQVSPWSLQFVRGVSGERWSSLGSGRYLRALLTQPQLYCCAWLREHQRQLLGSLCL